MNYVPGGIETIEEGYYSKFEFPCSYLCEQVLSAFRLTWGEGQPGVELKLTFVSFQRYPSANLTGKEAHPSP